MHRDPLAGLSDQELHRSTLRAVAQHRAMVAEMLDDIAEFDARRLYFTAGYSSMFLYLTEKLHLDQDEAADRIGAARVAARFPDIFAAVAEGRLHLVGINMLAPHLTEENAADLLAAAAHKSETELHHMLAAWFPSPCDEGTLDGEEPTAS